MSTANVPNPNPRLKNSPKANQKLMPIHKQIALGKKPAAPAISNPPKKQSK